MRKAGRNTPRDTKENYSQLLSMNEWNSYILNKQKQM